MNFYDVPEKVIENTARSIITSKLEWLRSNDFVLDIDVSSNKAIVQASIYLEVDEISVQLQNDRSNEFPECDICETIQFVDVSFLNSINDEPVCDDCFYKQEAEGLLKSKDN
ncbi:MAG: hypothetical protein ACPGSL_09990 [Vicingaceae bacterium]